MLKFFKPRPIEIYSPLDGETISINKINDQVFSQGMVGEGVAIIPQSTEIISPVDGTVSIIAETNHSVCIVTKEGLELIIHYGLDTVKYKGKGFEMKVKVGQRVNKGDVLFKADDQFFKERNVDLTSPVLVLNGDDFIVENINTKENIKAGKDILFMVKSR